MVLLVGRGQKAVVRGNQSLRGKSGQSACLRQRAVRAGAWSKSARKEALRVSRCYIYNASIFLLPARQQAKYTMPHSIVLIFAPNYILCNHDQANPLYLKLCSHIFTESAVSFLSFHDIFPEFVDKICCIFLMSSSQ